PSTETSTLSLHDALPIYRPDPAIAAADDVKLQVIEVGICGTDREEAAGGRSAPPPGRQDLVIGHEMFGRVVEVGSDVRAVAVGEDRKSTRLNSSHSQISY